MSTMRDAPVLRAVVDVLKDHVGKAFATLAGRIEAIEHELRKQISEIPHGLKGDPGESIKGERGDNGADAPDLKTILAGLEREVLPIVKTETAQLIEKRVREIELLPGPPGESIRGETGDSIKGDPGERGHSVHVGEGPPSLDAPKGDSYIDVKSGDVYLWV